MNTRGTRRWGSLSLVVLATASVLALLVTPAGAHTLPPPPGPLNGSGNVEGTEAILEESFLGFPCFRNTHTVFALRGAGTYTGVTAGGQPVVYKAEIGPNEKLNEVGPLHVEADTQVTFWHGPFGTFGPEGVNCTGTLGTPVPTEFRVFAADHVYNLDGGGAQVPCVGHGVFSRTGATWRGDWSLDQDCIVVGNAAGTPGTGVAPRGSVHTHEGAHEPCSYICPDNVRVDYKQYLAIPGSGITLVGPSNPQVGDTATVTARVTNDGSPVSGVTVDFSNAGPAATSPPSGSAVTGADGRASFSFGGSVVGAYTATATAPSATNPGQFITATHSFQFAPPDPPQVVASGPATGDTGAPMTVSALFTDARQPVEGVTINFAVAGPGQATPATGHALTDDEGVASFSFGADRAGDYTVTATADYGGQSPSGSHTVHVDIDTFFRQGALTADQGEDFFSAAVIDPAGEFAYFGTDTTPGRLVKVDLATFTRVGAITLNTGEDGVRSVVIDPSGQFAYLGTGRGSVPGPGRVVKIDLATFTRVGAITLNAVVEFADTEGNLTSAVIDPAGQFAYFGTNFSGAGRVVKIDLATFTRVGAIILEPDERGLNTAVMDPAGAYAYFGADGPTGLSGAVVKIDLATFTRVDALPMEIHLTAEPKAAVIDPAGQAAYFASGSTLVKIDLATFTRVRDIEFATTPASGVINSTGTRAYFGSRSGERVVEEVDLETFQPARRETMAAGETNLAAGVIAPDDATAYFGTGSQPGRVVKVALQRPPSPALAAGNDTYATNYLTPLSVAAPGVLANDVDTGDGDALVAGQVSDPVGGSVVLNADGSFTYTPDEGFIGVDTFTYTATDAKDYSAPATVSVTVGAAPAGVSAVGGGAMGWYTNVGLFGGPQEVRGGTGSSCGQEGQPACAVGQSPAVSLSPTGGDLAGSDPDGNLGQYGPAFIFENHGPIVVSSQGTTGPGGGVTSSALVNNVEDNDPFRAASPDGEISSTCRADESGLSGSTHIVNGSLVTHTDPSTGDPAETVILDHDYDPAPNTVYDGALDHVGDHWRIVFNEQILGPDSITVNAMHMYLLGTIAVGDMIIGQSRCSVTLDAANAAPSAGDDAYAVNKGGPLVLAGPQGLLANDSDPEAQPLRAARVIPTAPPTSGGGTWIFPSDPAHGALVLEVDGSFTYTPAPDYVGTESFVYETTDSRGKSDLAQVSITVNDQPVANDDTYGTTVGVPLTVAGPGVLGNDTDSDGGTLTASAPSDPPHGTVNLSTDGSFTYTNDPGYTGPDSFTYTAADGQGGSDMATVAITVYATNDPPVAGDDTYATDEDLPLTVNAPGVLGNDSDANANPLTTSAPSAPAHGALVLNANGSFTYTPAANYNGPDSFTYTVADGQGASDTASVAITVNTVDDAPVAGDDSYSTNEDTPVTVGAPGVLGNDTDAEGATLAASAPSDPPHGAVVLNANGSFTYTPDANYNGPDSFTYTAGDGTGGTDTAQVSITVNSVNDAPVATDETYATANGTLLTINAPGVLGNDTDVDADPLTATAPSDPAGGSVTLNANGSFTYSADPGFSGADTFTYTVGDGHGGSDTGLVTVNVALDGATMLADLTPGTGIAGSATTQGYVQMGPSVYFASYDPANRGIWRTDGTEAGTVRLTTSNVDTTTLRVMGDHLYFAMDDGIHGTELWRTDGTAAGMTLVKDINPGSAVSNPYQPTAIGDTLYFSAFDASHGSELWRSDGTEAGTVLVKDINPGGASSGADSFFAFDGMVLFRAADATHGQELWRTDGSEAGTVLVKDIRPGSSLSFIGGTSGGFTRFGDMVLFSATDAVNNSEMWRTDGTTEGTVVVKEINPSSGSNAGNYLVTGSKVLFRASDGVRGGELWQTDGTAAGTVLFKDIRPGSSSSLPADLTLVGGTVFFVANDGTAAGLHGRELWKTDGTAAGTVMVKDINPVPRAGGTSGTADSLPRDFAVLGDELYFVADDGVHGEELWQSDATSAGTLLVEDINPGPARSHDEFGASPLVPALGTMFFSADDGVHGFEPWRLNPVAAVPPSIAASPASVTAGDAITATWSDVATPSPTDWVGLYPSGGTLDPGLVSWAYTGGAASGSLNLSVPAGSPPGTTYEVRLFANNAYTRLATSAPFSVVASATAISASPSSVNPGAPVTATWSGISTPTATDWVGLYDSSSAPEPALLGWAYTNGSAAGSVNVFVPSGAPLGSTYELRLFTNNSYTRIATSAPFSVVASTATISESPSPANPGAPLTATWAGIGAPSATDWVGLYDSSSTPNPALLAWAYTNGTAAGSLMLFVPAGAPLASTYELRLFTANSYTRLATSAPFTVAVSNAAISASPGSVPAGNAVTATWSGIGAPTATDWVGLYATSADPDPAIVAWTYTGGTANGSLNLTVPAGAPPGTTYELRLYSHNSYTRLATSAPFSVT